MLKRFTFSVLSAAMVLSLGTGAAFASQGDRVSTAKAPTAASVQQQSYNVYISWTQHPVATHYQVSMREVNTDNHIIPEYVFGRGLDYYSLKDAPAGQYRVWVGAYDGHPKYGGRLLGMQERYIYVNGHTSVHLDPSRL